VATHDDDVESRRAAVARLTDQVLICRIAADDKDSHVRQAALAAIKDSALLVRFEGSYDRAVRIALIARWADKDRLAKYDETSHESMQSIILRYKTDGSHELNPHFAERATARVRMALLDPIVQARLPDARLITDYSDESREYGNLAQNIVNSPVEGESVKFEIEVGDRVVASAQWKTIFPQSVPSHWKFIPADIDLFPILQNLLSDAAFTQEDLAALTENSPIIEVVGGALANSKVRFTMQEISNLTDQQLLVKIALEDNDPVVRDAAIKRVTEQDLLAQVAQRGVDMQVLTDAVSAIGDQSLLEKIATDGKKSFVCQLAVSKITDQRSLARVAIGPARKDARRYAIYRLTDPDVLSAIARDEKDSDIRLAVRIRLGQLNHGGKGG
jgi:hypothetical protein